LLKLLRGASTGTATLKQVREYSNACSAPPLSHFGSGMMGHRALLSAVALGLCARPVGAFYDGLTSALVETALEDEWPVHYVGVGPL
jgi:hypothetical protein